MELLLHPMLSQATILNREIVRNIIIGNTLHVQSGPNIGATPLVAGVTAHELIFPAGTFGTVPDAGPVTYSVGIGPPPIVGGTAGIHGRIYVATDGTERFLDPTLSFINIHSEDLLTQVNQIFPQFGEVIFEKNSPIEETKRMAFYDYLQSGLMKLKEGTQPDLTFTHPKYQPIRSSPLLLAAAKGALTLDLVSSANFPANLAPTPVIVTVTDSVDILQGVNAGNYQITAVEAHRITVDSGVLPLLTVTGKDAGNNYKITPGGITPAGAKGTIFGAGGVVSAFTDGLINFAVFRDDDVDFTTTVDPNTTLPLSTGYSVRINRGELTEEVIQVESLGVGAQLNLFVDPGDITGQTSLLKFAHSENELVEIEGLNYSANSTYFTTSTVTAPTVAPAGVVTDGTAAFLATLLNGTSDVEFLTGDNKGLRRTITGVGGPTVVNVDPFPNAIGIGDEYRIIKRYAAGIDDVLYLDDTTGLPATNFTVIVDRGTEHEEVLYISANDITVTPNTLTISNNDIGTAFCAEDHGSSFAVEAAQVLMLSCDWDIIETRATGEYTIAASAECVPQIDLSSFFLHADVDLSKIGTVAHPAAGIAPGATEFTINLTGANSFASALENVGDQNGILNRALKFDNGVSVEEVFAIRQKNFTTIGHYDVLLEIYNEFIPVGTTVLPVKDASQFEGLGTGLISIEIDRNNPDPLIPETRVIALEGVDLANNNITITVGTGQTHNAGASIELTIPTILITDMFVNAFAVPAATDINLLYLDTIYRLKDPYNLGTFTEVPQGNLIESPPNASYLPITTTQDKKSIFPGSYVYNLPDADYPINDQPSSIKTTLASSYNGLDPTAIFKIPLTQEIIGSDIGGAITLGDDVGPGVSEILVADGRLFPEPIQNPFFIVLDHGFANEEIIQCVGKIDYPIHLAPFNPAYPFAFILQVDPTEVIKFDHYSRKYTVPQVFDISKVDLQVSKLVMNSVAGFGDDGGIFIDYGFNDNDTLLYNVNIDGQATSVLGAGAKIEDDTQTFQQYYAFSPIPGAADPAAASDPNALVGAFIKITAGTGVGQVREIATVNSNILLTMTVVWTTPPDVTSTYTIYGYIKVDNSEVGTNLTHVGGVINNAGGTTIVHPAREGGITQEYVKFSSKTGTILTLVQPTVFKKAHPRNTQVILGTGTVGPKTDGSSYQPFLYADFLTALFHKDVGNFGSIIKAAGIEIKAEDTDA